MADGGGSCRGDTHINGSCKTTPEFLQASFGSNSNQRKDLSDATAANMRLNTTYFIEVTVPARSRSSYRWLCLSFASCHLSHLSIVYCGPWSNISFQDRNLWVAVTDLLSVYNDVWRQPWFLWLANHRQEYHHPRARYWSSVGRCWVLLENEISISIKMVSEGSVKPPGRWLHWSFTW